MIATVRYGEEFKAGVVNLSWLRWLLTPENIALLAVALASEHTISITGVALTVDGGFPHVGWSLRI